MTPALLRSYDSLADVLEYPRADYREKVRVCQEVLESESSPAAEPFRRFTEGICGFSARQLEELFTRTFDLDPLCCLETGWHLFGENYDRGSFLVRMRQELRRLGLEETNELPDHLSLVLRALARMEEDRAADFISDGVAPALDKMLEGLAKKENPYRHVIAAVKAAVDSESGMSTGEKCNE